VALRYRRDPPQLSIDGSEEKEEATLRGVTRNHSILRPPSSKRGLKDSLAQLFILRQIVREEKACWKHFEEGP